MSSYKQFLASDIIVSPLELNKGFTFYGNDLTGSNVGIDRFLGKNITSSIFNINTDETTGFIEPQFQRLIYKSIQELYYSNYISSSYGNPVSRPQLIPGLDQEGDRYIGSASNQAYDNYLQSTLTFPRFFPTGSNNILGVISLPIKLYGDYIKPNSFRFTSDSGSLFDDGEGNIISGSNIVGNIIYSHGLVIITGNSQSYTTTTSVYGSAIYGSSLYGPGATFADEILNYITSSNVTCSFSSSYTIFENQYKCTINQNEFNLTLNPSVISSSLDGSVYGFVTKSYFTPYITTVGLYNDEQELLAVAKLAQPLPMSPTTDLTILIGIDR